jgi:hypothetical protein
MLNSRLYEFDKSQLSRLRNLYVLGDIHGDYGALASFLNLVDLQKDGIIFLGDYADRLPLGVEVIDTVDSLIKKYPNVIALKGNHEDYTDSGSPTFKPCDLIGEVIKKKGNWQKYFHDVLKPFIENLYLAVVIPDETLFVHGGVYSGMTLHDLKHPTRTVEENVIWSDPTSGIYGEIFNEERNLGVKFGINVTKTVCESLGVKRIIRSHQPDKAIDGPYYEHNGRVITISSTSLYGGKPFVLIIDPNNPSSIIHRFLL